MKIIKVQKAPQQSLLNSEDILIRFCLHFPQYKYSEAKKMPFRRVMRMLKVARQEEAKRMHDLVQIAAAPHTKDGKAIESLLSYYKEIIEG